MGGMNNAFILGRSEGRAQRIIRGSFRTICQLDPGLLRGDVLFDQLRMGL